MTQGNYQFAMLGELCVIKPVGNIDYTISPDLDSFLEKIFVSDSVAEILIDLSETTYIDSTNLGLLAQVHEFSLNRLHRRAALISTNPQINEILGNLGFDRIFEIVSDAHGMPDTAHQLCSADKTRESIGATLLKAHEYLITLNQRNQRQFHNVVEYLKKDIRASKVGENRYFDRKTRDEKRT